VERVSATLASTYAYVNPPVALFVGWWLGNESFSANTLVGLPIVLAGVGLLAWAQARAQGISESVPKGAPMTLAKGEPACISDATNRRVGPVERPATDGQAG
jgi:hypothetical protein